jgi:hypothetical protein
VRLLLNTRLALATARPPADRFLVATALEHDLTLVTADQAMRAFEPVATLWRSAGPGEPGDQLHGLVLGEALLADQ